jgi:hypothetical protein
VADLLEIFLSSMATHVFGNYKIIVENYDDQKLQIIRAIKNYRKEF